MRNCEMVDGREYKKYIVYALFDYLCSVKPSLYILNRGFARSVSEKLDEFIALGQGSGDRAFHEACMSYKSYLQDYFTWAGAKTKPT